MVTEHYAKNSLKTQVTHKMKKNYLYGGSPSIANNRKNKTGVFSGRHNYDTPSHTSPIKGNDKRSR